MHGAAFTSGITTLTPGQLCHHAFGVHATRQHVAMVTIRRHALITFFSASLKANDDRFLSDIQVAKAADQAHAIQLAGLFFESTDHQHFVVMV